MDNMLEIPTHNKVCPRNGCNGNMAGIIQKVERQNFMNQICISELRSFSGKLKNIKCSLLKFLINTFYFIWSILDFCFSKLR